MIPQRRENEHVRLAPVYDRNFEQFLCQRNRSKRLTQPGTLAQRGTRTGLGNGRRQLDKINYVMQKNFRSKIFMVKILYSQKSK